MSAERVKNVVQMPVVGLLAELDRLIDARVDARLKALGIAECKPTRKELRLKAGFINLRDLAVAAQVSACWISMLERGQIGNPGSRSRAGLDRLCAVLGVAPYEYCRAATND